MPGGTTGPSWGPFTWDAGVGVEEFAALGTFLLTLVGLVFIYKQLKHATRISRAQFLLDITERYFSEVQLRKLYYALNWNTYRPNVGTIPLSEEEQDLDHLLYYFDLVGRMVKLKALSFDEVTILAFQARRVLDNPYVRMYLAWLDQEFQGQGFSAAHDEARELVKSVHKRIRLDRKRFSNVQEPNGKKGVVEVTSFPLRDARNKINKRRRVYECEYFDAEFQEYLGIYSWGTSETPADLCQLCLDHYGKRNKPGAKEASPGNGSWAAHRA